MLCFAPTSAPLLLPHTVALSATYASRSRPTPRRVLVGRNRRSPASQPPQQQQQPVPPSPQLGSPNGGTPGGTGTGRGGRGNNNRDDNNNNNPPRSLFALYLHYLSTRPLPTKIATSALLTLLSDLIAQLFETRAHPPTPRLNRRRLLSLFLVGALLTAPFFHYLYAYLERYLPASSGPAALFAQLAVDQLLAAPAWLLMFFGMLAVLDPPFDRHALRKQVDRDFVPALKLAWTVFPPVQFLSFAFLPPVTRVLTLNVVDLAYTTVLSYIKHRPHAEDMDIKPKR